MLCLLLLFIAKCQTVDSNNLQLKQVLIFSRHNIRTTFSDKLETYSPKKWPKQDQKPGHLTRKGALLEGYMGEYFAEWFKKEDFLQGKCPSEDMVYVYANSVNRTVATAKAFVETALKGCNVTVNHKHNIDGDMDSTFSSGIRNSTDAFKNRVIDTINKSLKRYELKSPLLELNKILNIKEATVCKTKSICDLSDLSKSNISFAVGRELWVNGPMFIAITVLDSFLMTFYEGLPIEEVAWGLVRTAEQIKKLSVIIRLDHFMRYTNIAKDIAAPLVKYFTDTFLNYNKMPKLMLIVGHDYNLNSVFYSMGFKSISWPNQYETFPIGGKIVFQRWTDNKSDYLKIEYIYPTWTQIRNGTKLSLANPPQKVLLQLKWCQIDRNGFCPWNTFINELRLRQ